MSWKGQAWAAEQRAGGSSAKLVLLIYASFASEQGHAYPSNATLSEMTELDPKTVRAAVDQLVARGLLIDTGRRAGATKQVRVYQLGMESLPKPAGLGGDGGSNASTKAQEAQPEGLPESLPEAEALKTTDIPGKGTQKRVAEPTKEPLPLEEANASSAPQGARKGRGFKIPDDWAPPPIERLPAAAAVIARQWPPGAYGVQAEAFRLYWRGEGRAGSKKHNWGEAWAHRVITLGARPVLDAKAGLRYETPPEREPQTADAGAAATLRAEQLAGLREAEGEAEQAIRAAMLRRMGARLYEQWFKACVLSLGETLVVTAPSSFARAWLQQHYAGDLAASVVAVVGLEMAIVFRLPDSGDDRAAA